MTLSSYRMHRIYLAATMGYGLGSDDPEELSYYNKIIKEMEVVIILDQLFTTKKNFTGE